MTGARKTRVAVLIAGAAVLAAVSAVAAGWLWSSSRPPEPAYRLRPDNGVLTAMGQRVYAAHCAACHGVSLEGQANWRERGPDGRLPAPPHDASGPVTS